MQLRSYHRSWQQVDLTGLANAADVPAGPELYRQFYMELERGHGGPNRHWMSTKRTLGEQVARRVFEPWARHMGRQPRILALAVGLGAAESVWLERGYDVTMHDCQETSLHSLLERFPGTPVLLGDLRNIALPAGFDIVVMLASEYMLSREELARLAEAVKASLAPDGCFILHSVCVLSMLRLVKQCLKRIARRNDTGVFWGWMRTPAELAHNTMVAGLAVETAYRVVVNGSHTVLKERSRLMRTQPTLHDESVLLVLA